VEQQAGLMVTICQAGGKIRQGGSGAHNIGEFAWAWADMGVPCAYEVGAKLPVSSMSAGVSRFAFMPIPITDSIKDFAMKKMHLFAVAVFCLLAATLVRADGDVAAGPKADLPFVTGQHWTDSSEEQKRAYLYGIGNMLELQQALAQKGGAKSAFVDDMIKGLSPLELDGVEKALDAWYAGHPDEIHRPVIEVMYLNIARPRL
jgi:hypothetical protein